jgi:hypothetical protein
VPEPKSVAPADLLIDPENPRLVRPNVGQRDALREIANQQGAKLLALAEDVLNNGLNPSELPIIMPLHDDRKRYVVLEGNRRIAALKALENPESIAGAVDQNILDRFRELSKQYQDEPTELVSCMVVANREEAQHWIELRHTGENRGIGIVKWGADEATRFRARSRSSPIHTQVLDLLESRGHLTPEDRSKVPSTSLERLLKSPEVREKVGIEFRDGTLLLRAAEKPVCRALNHVVTELRSGDVKTGDIYTKEQRQKYAKELPSNIVVTPTVKTGKGQPISAAQSSVKAKRQAKQKKRKARTVLIPGDCVLTVTDTRISDIEGELRSLSLEDFPNAASVLFRVFLELSADAYIAADPNLVTATANRDKLTQKLQEVVSDLTKRQKLTKQQGRPVLHACSKNSLLSPSLNLLNDYVHNQHTFPGPSDLRADWNSLQPFFTAIWSP